MLRAASFLPSQLRAAWEHLDKTCQDESLRVDLTRVRVLLFGCGPYEFLPSAALPYRTPHPLHLPVTPLYVNAKNGHRYTPADPSDYCYRSVDDEWSALYDPLLAFTDRFYFAVPSNAVASRRRGSAVDAVYEDDSCNPMHLPIAGGSVALRVAAIEDAPAWDLEIQHVVECRDASGLVQFDTDLWLPTLRGYPHYDAPEVFAQALQRAILMIAADEHQ
jgi:hypothetical protein